MISVEDVRYISKLAKLRFSDEEIEKLEKEFEIILKNFEEIDKVDLSDVSLNEYDSEIKSVTRKDKEEVFEDKEKLFRNVKTKRDKFIEVPKIIE